MCKMLILRWGRGQVLKWVLESFLEAQANKKTKNNQTSGMKRDNRDRKRKEKYARVKRRKGSERRRMRKPHHAAVVRWSACQQLEPCQSGSSPYSSIPLLYRQRPVFILSFFLSLLYHYYAHFYCRCRSSHFITQLICVPFFF